MHVPYLQFVRTDVPLFGVHLGSPLQVNTLNCRQAYSIDTLNIVDITQNLSVFLAVMKCIVMIKINTNKYKKIKIVKRSRDGGAKSMHTRM